MFFKIFVRFWYNKYYMKKLSLGLTAFLQAAILTFYCLMIGNLMWNANHLFGKMNSFLGPALFLIIFVISAIICTLIFGYNAFIIFWEEKNTKKALKLILYTTLWLFAFGILIVGYLAIFGRYTILN